MSSDSPFFKESGMIGMCEPMTHFNLESPGGLVKVVAECQGGQVKSVSLESMPSFVGYMNKKVNYIQLFAVSENLLKKRLKCRKMRVPSSKS